jgi:diguanylate cyclase
MVSTQVISVDTPPPPVLQDAIAILAMVRETVAAMSGEQATLHDSLTGSASRFERLATLENLHEVQALLLEEVAALKRVTEERQAAWEQTFEAFGKRVSTLEHQLDRTRQEASLDPLTGVANRRTLERACRDWLEPNRPGFVMAMVDVDDFKAINDTQGHGVGDQVLIAIAGTLSRSMRAGDLVARLGGDEFAILAVGLTLPQAEGRFNAIGRAVQDAIRPLVKYELSASVSIGVAERSAGDTMETLQRRADEALYQAKKHGKGRVASKSTPLIRDLMKGRHR